VTLRSVDWSLLGPRINWMDVLNTHNHGNDQCANKRSWIFRDIFYLAYSRRLGCFWVEEDVLHLGLRLSGPLRLCILQQCDWHFQPSLIRSIPSECKSIIRCSLVLTDPSTSKHLSFRDKFLYIANFISNCFSIPSVFPTNFSHFDNKSSARWSKY
jgi:hypothetical protein